MNYNIEIIDVNSEKYPDNLKRIANPPQKLYVIGNVDNLRTNSIAVIGSRICSEKGADTAKNFSYKLSKCGLTIVSGMAKGIDTLAHIGALEAGGKTIAVLGGGFKHIFPKENVKLSERIIKENGTIVSEYKEDEEPSSIKFIERNRIVSRSIIRSISSRSKEKKWHKYYCKYCKKPK